MNSSSAPTKPLPLWAWMLISLAVFLIVACGAFAIFYRDPSQAKNDARPDEETAVVSF